MRVVFSANGFKTPNFLKPENKMSANFSANFTENGTLNPAEKPNAALNREYLQANFCPMGFCSTQSRPVNFDAINFTSSKRVPRKNIPIARFDGSVRCPCCGDRMQNFNKNDARKLALEISKKRGEELSDILKRNMGNFQANKRNLVREIARLAPRHPEKRLSELLCVLSNKYTDALRMKQIIVAMQIPREIENLTPENQAAIKEWQVNQIQRIISASEEGQFRNKHLVTSFINFAREKGITIDEERIRNYFNKLPSSKKDPEAFVIKYQRRTSKEAAYRMIKNTEPTIEHIIPFSKSGNNRIENLLVMCSDCNTIRGDMSYDDFIAQHPEMLQNIDKYFADIKRVLNDKKTRMLSEDREKYKNYVKDVQRTLEEYSPEYFDFKHRQ